LIHLFMNCHRCGEVCHCSAEAAPASVPRWVSDPWVNDPSMASASEAALAGPGVELAAPEGQDTAPSPEAAPKDASPDSGSGEAQPESATAWREELAARISHYRSRRKPLPPRYPSLRLAFEPPKLRTAADGEIFGACGSVSPHALALDPFSTSAPSVLDAEAPQSAPAANESSPSGSDRSTLTGGTPPHKGEPPLQRQARIIEFPRLTSAAPPAPLNELAEPVSDRPRILDVPDAVPPPPALGGITIEPALAAEAEKLPGVDIPLQSAPLARRLVACVIDAVLVAAASTVSGFIFWKIAGVRPPKFQLTALFAITPGLLWMAYQYLLLVYAGSTPGLRLTKLELARFSGRQASRRLRRWRVLASYLSALSLGMGYVWVFLDEDGLCWHDRITHTYLAPMQNADSISETHAIS
jgi:uncharacterized RDD family membrane protein YckC